MTTTLNLASTPVDTTGISGSVTITRLDSGRLLVQCPRNAAVAEEMRSLRAHRVRLVDDPTRWTGQPGVHSVEGTHVQGRTVLHVAKAARVEGDFGWTVAEGREAELLAVLRKHLPSEVNSETQALFEGLSPEVRVTVRSADGMLLIRTPYRRGVPDTLRTWGGRWDAVGSQWLVPVSRAAQVVDFLGRVYGTVDDHRARIAAEVEQVREAIRVAGEVLAAEATATATSDGRALVIAVPDRHGVRDALRSREARWDRTRRAWLVPAESAVETVRAVHAILSETDEPLTDDGTPPLPWSSWRKPRNQRGAWCFVCRVSVAPGQGWLQRGDDCLDERWVVTCAPCVWRGHYGLRGDTDPWPWVDLGLPVDRVRRLAAAGITPDEIAAEPSLVDADDDTLAGLAALRRFSAA